MKSEIAKLWVDALRSGEYNQGLGVLAREIEFDGEIHKSYCCLGVLCIVAKNQGIPLELGRVFDSTITSFDGYTSSLPPSVEDWAGMHTPNGDLLKGYSLAYKNDDGNTFEEIANVIESHVEEL